MLRQSICLAAATAALSSVSNAQVASAILRVGDAPIGAGAGVTVSTIAGMATNQVGGVGVRVGLSNTDAGIWGSATSTAGVLLREEQLGISGYDQTAFEGFFGIDDTASLAYSPTCTDTTTLVTGLDCVWQDNMPLAVQDVAIPTLPGKKFRFASRPGITGNGIPYWVSGINDIATNANEGEGLFLGTSLTPILKTGDPAPSPLTSTLNGSAADFDVRYSNLGTHYILAIVTTDPAASDTHLVIDGAIVLDAGGTRISEGQAVSAAAGGVGGELYSNFSSLGVNEAGDYMAFGDTSAAAAVDGFIMKNGVFVHREGDVIGGLTLTGNLISAGAYMNEAGDIAFAWDTTGAITGIFYNSTLLLKEGDAVDFDGDGIVEATSIFKATTGIASMVLGNTHVFFSATVTVMGVDQACVLAIAIPSTPASAYCFGDGTDTACPCTNPGLAGRGCDNTVASGGARLASSGFASVSADTLVLNSTFAVPFGPGLYYEGNATANPVAPFGVVFGNGLRCAGGATNRLEIRFADASGAASTTVALGAFGAAVAGNTYYYQLWYRDTGNVGTCTPGAGFNFSSALSLAWSP